MPLERTEDVIATLKADIDENLKSIDENLKSMNNGLIFDYIQQMAERHASEIDRNFWLVVKEKPKWMPSFIYRAVIKELVSFNQVK